jgi:hypothetical protein
VSTAFLAAATLSVSRASAQDVNAMARWTSLKVVHYHAVGEFSGPIDEGGVSASVIDRVDIEFDWDQKESKLVGQPVIKNVPTKVGAIKHDVLDTCPAPRVEGTFEYWTVVEITSTVMQLQLQVRRDHPDVATPYGDDRRGAAAKCGDLWNKAAAKSETFTVALLVPPAMVLAVPEAGAFEITKDGKSIIMKEDTDGWVWTLTPTPVK